MKSNLPRALAVWAAITAILCGFAYQHYRIVALQQRLEGSQVYGPIVRAQMVDLEKRIRVLAEIQPRAQPPSERARGPLTDSDIQASARLADVADEVSELKRAVQDINRTLSNERPDTANFREQLAGKIEKFENRLDFQLKAIERDAEGTKTVLSSKISDLGVMQSFTLTIATGIVLPLGIYLFVELRKLRSRKKTNDGTD